MTRNLVDTLHSQRSQLTKSQQTIGDFLIQSTHTAAFMTAADIARSVGVSESSVVRFARVVGFSGFPELQGWLRETLLETLTPPERLDRVQGSRDEEGLARRCLEVEATNLQLAAERLDIASARSIARSLFNARRRYIVGMRSSSTPAVLLAHFLGMIFPHVEALTEAGGPLLERLSWAGEGDALVAFSFPRYTRETVEAVRIAATAGAVTGVITDTKVSPAAQIARYHLIAPSTSVIFGNSYTSAIALCNLIVALCINFDPSRVRERLVRLEDTFADRNLFYDTRRLRWECDT